MPLLFVIILNLTIPILAWFCLFIYYYRCKVYENNKSKTIDPFVNMVYDPNICQNLNRDHYFFEVELRCKTWINLELQGFTFNYNDKLKDQLNLRKERGKVKFMVYNGDFWIHYHGFVRYKSYHWIFAFLTTIIAIGANVMWFFIIFWCLSPLLTNIKYKYYQQINSEFSSLFHPQIV